MGEEEKKGQVVVAAFYLFTELPSFAELQAPLLAFCREQGLRGSILLAPEGINGTVGGEAEALDALMGFLHRQSGLETLTEKRSFANHPIHLRMKVRLKKEIVSFDMPDFDPADPNEGCGTYVDPADWNELIARDDVTLVDTRNTYEVDVGTFKGAVNPETETFRDFIDYTRSELDPDKQQKVAMFCTGGIRCEKASAYLRAQGFKEVFHLRGGILKYLEEIPPDESAWEGECFVFDERVTVNHELQPGSFEKCRGCRNPISEADRNDPEFEEGVSCKYCYSKTTEERKARFRERERQVRLANERGEKHVGERGESDG